MNAAAAVICAAADLLRDWIVDDLTITKNMSESTLPMIWTVCLVGGAVVAVAAAHPPPSSQPQGTTGGITGRAVSVATGARTVDIGRGVAGAAASNFLGGEVVHVAKQYTVKLKIITSLLSIQMPLAESIPALERALISGLGNIDRVKPLLHDGDELTTESKDAIFKMADIVACIAHQRQRAAERTIVAVVGTKNSGKSTLVKLLVPAADVETGSNVATRVPTPYERSANCTIVDFPGSTDVLDENLQLARQYLCIRGSGERDSWCVVMVNPWTMGIPDCECISAAANFFGIETLLIVCTHGDDLDANQESHVVKHGGVDGVKRYVADMLSQYRNNAVLAQLSLRQIFVASLSCETGTNRPPNVMSSSDLLQRLDREVFIRQH